MKCQGTTRLHKKCQNNIDAKHNNDFCFLHQEQSTKNKPQKQSTKKPSTKKQSTKKQSTKKQSIKKQRLSKNKQEQEDEYEQSNKPFFASGTYGCVYYPPLPCLDNQQYNKTHRNYIMKIRDPTRDSEDQMAAKVRLIDPEYKRFIPLSGQSCKIDIKSKDVTFCSAVKDDVTNVRGYFVKYGGMTLLNYLSQHVISLQQVWDWLLYLLESVALLVQHKIYHTDIKLANIVIGKDNVPKLIDFGLAFTSLPKTCYKLSIYPCFYNARNASVTEEDLPGQLFKRYGFNRNQMLDVGPFADYKKQRAKNPASYDQTVVLPNLDKLDSYEVCYAFYFWMIPRIPKKNQTGKLFKSLIEIMTRNLHPIVDECWTVTETIDYMKKQQK